MPKQQQQQRQQQTSCAASSVDDDGDNETTTTNAKQMLLEGSANPDLNAAPSTAKNRFLAFPADISLVSEENRILRMARETEEFNQKSENERRKIKLNRGASGLMTVDSVATDLQKRKNAAAAQLRVQMMKMRGEEIPASLSRAHQLQQLQAQVNPEFRAKLDQAIIESMNFGIHCDDDDSIPWQGPSIALLEQSDELTEQERKLQEKEIQHHHLQLNGKYWMSVYAAAQSKVGGAASRQQQIAQAKLLQKQQLKRKSVLDGGGDESIRSKDENESSGVLLLSIPANANIPVSALLHGGGVGGAASDSSKYGKSSNAPKEILIDDHGAVIEKPVVLSGRSLDFSAGEAAFVERKRIRYEQETKRSLEQYRKRQEQEKKEEEQSEKEKLLLRQQQQQKRSSSQIATPEKSLRRYSQSSIIPPTAPAFSPIPPSAPSTARSTMTRNTFLQQTSGVVTGTPRRPTSSSAASYYYAQDPKQQKAWESKIQREKEALQEIATKFQRNEDKRHLGLQAVLDRPQQLLNDRYKVWAPSFIHVKFIETLNLALRKKRALEKLKQYFSDPVRIWLARRKELKKVLAEARFGSFASTGRQHQQGFNDEQSSKTASPASITLMNTEMVKSEYDVDDADSRASSASDHDDNNDQQQQQRQHHHHQGSSASSPLPPQRSRSQSPNSFFLGATTSFLRGSFEQNLVDAKRLDATFNPFTHNANWTNEQLREMKALREEETKKRAPLSIHELLGCSLARGLVSAKSMEESTKLQLLEKMRNLFVPVWTAPLNEETEKYQRDACLCKELLENGQDYIVYVRRGHLAMRTSLDLNPDYYAIHVAESAYESAKKTATGKYFELHPLAAAERDELLKKQKAQQQLIMMGKKFSVPTSQQNNNNNTNIFASSVNSSASARFSSSQAPLVPSRPFSASSIGGIGNNNNTNVKNVLPPNTARKPQQHQQPASNNATTQLLRQHFLNQNNMNNVVQQQQLTNNNIIQQQRQQQSQTGVPSYQQELDAELAKIPNPVPKESPICALRFSLPSLVELEDASNNAQIVGNFVRTLAMIDLSNKFPIESFPLLYPNPKMEISVRTFQKENEQGETEITRIPRLTITSTAIPPLGFLGTRRCVFEGKPAASASQYEPTAVSLNAIVNDPITEHQKGRKQQTRAIVIPSTPQHVCDVRSGDAAEISYSLVPETSVDMFIAPVAAVKQLISESLPWYIVARQVEIMKLLGVECTVPSGHSPYSSAQSIAIEGERAVATALEEQTSTNSTRMSAVPRPLDVTKFTLSSQQKTRESLISLASETALLTQTDWSNESIWLERVIPNLSILETIAQRCASLWGNLRREDISIIKNLPPDRVPTRYTVRGGEGEMNVRYYPHSLQDARKRCALVWNDLVLSALNSVHRLENGTTFPTLDDLSGKKTTTSLVRTTTTAAAAAGQREDSSDESASSASDREGDESSTSAGATSPQITKQQKHVLKSQLKEKEREHEERVQNMMAATFDRPLLDQCNGNNVAIQIHGGLELYEPGTTIKRRRDKNAGRAIVVIRGVVISEEVKEENGFLHPIRNTAKYYFRQPTSLGLKNDARVIHALMKGLKHQFNFSGLKPLIREIALRGTGTSDGRNSPSDLQQQNFINLDASLMGQTHQHHNVAGASGFAASVKAAAAVKLQQHQQPYGSSSKQQQSVAQHIHDFYQLANGEKRLITPTNVTPVGSIPVINATGMLKNHVTAPQNEVIFAKTSALVLHVPWKGKIKDLLVKHGLILVPTPIASK